MLMRNNALCKDTPAGKWHYGVAIQDMSANRADTKNEQPRENSKRTQMVQDTVVPTENAEEEQTVPMDTQTEQEHVVRLVTTPTRDEGARQHE